MSLSDALATLAAMIVPRGRVALDIDPLTASPGSRLSCTVTYAALEKPRLVRALRIHFQVTATHLRVGSNADGSQSMNQVADSRDLMDPMLLCTDLPVPAHRQWSTSFELTVPGGSVQPSIPGQFDYHVVARVAVDGESVGAWTSVPVIIAGGEAAASLRGMWPGSSCTALDSQGVRGPAMVVEVRGAVTLVQWADGRPATWVRSDDVRVVEET
ncbi:MAG: hypothetical protein JRI23_27090 [Deltaproteobacteria bacterium]|jgi:hypothetical protein|nr:hypothetical protein [Deltaproteobacteria bacterium]MBW2535748.1 hypothetical protein [Deltaproteobacteria bacterium]